MSRPAALRRALANILSSFSWIAACCFAACRAFLFFAESASFATLACDRSACRSYSSALVSSTWESPSSGNAASSSLASSCFSPSCSLISASRRFELRTSTSSEATNAFAWAKLYSFIASLSSVVRRAPCIATYARDRHARATARNLTPERRMSGLGSPLRCVLTRLNSLFRSSIRPSLKSGEFAPNGLHHQNTSSRHSARNSLTPQMFWQIESQTWRHTLRSRFVQQNNTHHVPEVRSSSDDRRCGLALRFCDLTPARRGRLSSSSLCTSDPISRFVFFFFFFLIDSFIAPTLIYRFCL